MLPFPAAEGAIVTDCLPFERVLSCDRSPVTSVTWCEPGPHSQAAPEPTGHARPSRPSRRVKTRRRSATPRRDRPARLSVVCVMLFLPLSSADQRWTNAIGPLAAKGFLRRPATRAIRRSYGSFTSASASSAARANAELPHSLRQVALDGARREHERLGNLLVRLPHRGKPEHLLLSRREPAAVALPSSSPRPRDAVLAQGPPHAGGIPSRVERLESSRAEKSSSFPSSSAPEERSTSARASRDCAASYGPRQRCPHALRAAERPSGLLGLPRGGGELCPARGERSPRGGRVPPTQPGCDRARELDRLGSPLEGDQRSRGCREQPRQPRPKRLCARPARPRRAPAPTPPRRCRVPAPGARARPRRPPRQAPSLRSSRLREQLRGGSSPPGSRPGPV